MTDEVSAYTPFNADEVRKGTFANAYLDQAVKDVVSKIPADHMFALVGVADKDSARVAVYIRPNENLSFAGFIDREWKGSIDYGAEVIVSF